MNRAHIVRDTTLYESGVRSGKVYAFMRAFQSLATSLQLTRAYV